MVEEPVGRAKKHQIAWLDSSLKGVGWQAEFIGLTLDETSKAILDGFFKVMVRSMYVFTW